ncbi:MAG TPA: MarC family protein [Stellaceae bacterium]|jgi:multiple antibiotic resistance protein|nr:MarC family protein [Stellaceae bacterium]
MLQATNIFLLVFAALFPIVNPIGNAPIFLRLTAHCSAKIRYSLARRIALMGFVLLVGSLLFGSKVLEFFGITLPIVRVAGGLVVAIMGWRLLNQGENPIESDTTQHLDDDTTILDQAFYPLTMPLTVGPGSIATAIALGTEWPLVPADFKAFFLETASAVVGLAAVALAIYLSYRFADWIERVLGRTGTNVLVRLSAFILLCIGLQILWNGTLALLQSVHG